MIAGDFTVLSGISAPCFKLLDAWLSISSGKFLLHVSVTPWLWWRGQCCSSKENVTLYLCFRMFKKKLLVLLDTFSWVLFKCLNHSFSYCMACCGFTQMCLSRLVEVTCYGSQTSLYDLETAVPSVLKPDLIDV